MSIENVLTDCIEDYAELRDASFSAPDAEQRLLDWIMAGDSLWDHIDSLIEAAMREMKIDLIDIEEERQ